MKCTACHKHFKPERNLDTLSTCPDCSQVYDNTVQLKQLFEEIIVRHVVLAELRDIYRHKLKVLLNAQNKPIYPLGIPLT